jgi:hypothetical protein
LQGNYSCSLRAIWRDLKQIMEKSMLSQINAATLSTFLASAHLATMGWKGSQTNYAYYYKEQACKFNENSEDPYTKKMLCQFMENLLTEVPYSFIKPANVTSLNNNYVQSYYVISNYVKTACTVTYVFHPLGCSLIVIHWIVVAVM